MTTSRENEKRLDAALDELALHADELKPEMLEAVIRRYPEYAAELTKFAVELVVNALHAGEDENDEPLDLKKLPREVSNALSDFQNRLHQLKTNRAEAVATSVDPFGKLTRAEFRGLASRMHANSLFMSKLAGRLIDPETISEGCRRWLAEDLAVPIEAVSAHLMAPPTVSAAAFDFKADDKPQLAVRRQTFKEAVATSQLSEEQQRFLLDL